VIVAGPNGSGKSSAYQGTDTEAFLRLVLQDAARMNETLDQCLGCAARASPAVQSPERFSTPSPSSFRSSILTPAAFRSGPISNVIATGMVGISGDGR
jgi:hypothetical protein